MPLPNPTDSPLYVTQPYLPALEELTPLLKQIWDSHQLTNGGPFHQQLEAALAEHLGVKHLSLFNNGTVALLTALQALEVEGEVITTPYTFVATAHALLWNRLTPVFVDIDPATGNLDPTQLEAAITRRTNAILPVHCYGTPCDTSSIGLIARQHGLKLIYDAAHAFGVQDAGGSVLRHGDLSVLSFHATKVFHTFEGGAIVCHDAETKARIDHLKNFGFVNQTTVVSMGINGKMNEFQAAFGLLMLKHMPEVLRRRRIMSDTYREALRATRGVTCLTQPTEVQSNYAYFPVTVDPEFGLGRDEVFSQLGLQGINTRRYFYPLVSDFPMYQHLPTASSTGLPAARRLAERVLCLPLHAGSANDALRVIDAIRGLQ